MTGLEVAGLDVAYGRGPLVVTEVDLTVPAGGLVALLGPSGCGKSTVLKAVAGLVEPASGTVRVDGRPVHALAAERRQVGLVFQRPLLFGHLSVGDNVGFGLRMRGVARAKRRGAVAAMLERVGLPGLAGRRVTELSGGQEQRVALARALVLDPRVLLLDEPFSQLDADLRERMRELVREIQRDLGLTTVFVTHDQQEAVDLADAITLMFDGRVESHGPPASFYTDPATLAAARFFGALNELPGVRAGSEFAAAPGRLQVPTPGPDGPGVLVVRPEALRLVPDAGRPNTLAAVVREVRFRGTHRSVVCEAGGAILTVWVAPALPVEPGERVHLQLPPAACRVLAPDTAARAPQRVEDRTRA